MEKNRSNMIYRAQNRRMREFSNGQEVFIRNFGVGSRWISGVTVNSSGPLTWLIKLDGKMVIWHARVSHSGGAWGGVCAPPILRFFSKISTTKTNGGAHPHLMIFFQKSPPLKNNPPI